MNEKFFNLNKEKQMKILNAAIDEFASSGYDQASTNTIVKKAGISKGLLFHYFSSKKELYTFIYNFGMDIVLKEFEENIDFNVKDFLLFLKDVIVVKMKLMREYPNIFNFFISCYMDTSEEIEELNIRSDERSVKINKIVYENVDFSFFKDEIDKTKAMNTIRWTFEQYSMTQVQKIQLAGEKMEPDKVESELNAYIELFRNAFYK